MPTFSIGQLAKRAGVAIDTVRYYERNAMLTPAGRLESGYRRELLSLSDERKVAKVKLAAQAKLAEVEQRLAELERIRNGLRALVAACPGHGRAEACPILNALNEEDTP